VHVRSCWDRVHDRWPVVTAVDVVPDVELIEHLDFDVELACEVAWHDRFECGEPVAGVIRCRGCRVSKLSSVKCWQRLVELTKIVPFKCSTCGRPGRTVEVFEFITIGGQS
jgi:hypothetical protein